MDWMGLGNKRSLLSLIHWLNAGAGLSRTSSSPQWVCLQPYITVLLELFFNPHHPCPFFAFDTINSFFSVNKLSYSMASMTPHWICSYFFVSSNLVSVISSSFLSSFAKGLILDLLPSLSHDALTLQMPSSSPVDSVIIQIFSWPKLFPEHDTHNSNHSQHLHLSISQASRAQLNVTSQKSLLPAFHIRTLLST